MSREFSGTPHQLVANTNVIFSALIAYHFLRWHYISMLESGAMIRTSGSKTLCKSGGRANWLDSSSRDYWWLVSGNQHHIVIKTVVPACR